MLLVFSAALADVGDDAALAFRPARLADIAPVQDQPVMRVAHVFFRDDPDEALLDLFGRLAGRQAEPVADAEDVRVDRHGRLAEGHVEHDIGGLAPDARQLDQKVAVIRHLAAMVADQRLRQRDHVLRLAAPKPDRADVFADLLLAQRHHLLRRVGDVKQRARRLVDAGVGRLRRQHHGDQQREGVPVLEFALGLRPLHRKAAENLLHLGRRVERMGPRPARAALGVRALTDA